MAKLNFRLSYLLWKIANKSTFEIPEETLRTISRIREMLENNNVTLGTRESVILASIKNLYAACNNSDNEEIRDELFSLIDALYRHVRRRFILSKKSSEYNTEDYYKKTIAELNEQINDLNNKLESRQSDEQKEKIKKELEERKEQIKLITADKEELEKKLDAQKI